MSPALVLQIRAVALGTSKEVRAPFDHEPVKHVICGVSVEIGQVVDEPLPVEVERRIAEDPVSGACFEGNEQIMELGVCAWAHRLKSGCAVHVRYCRQRVRVG